MRRIGFLLLLLFLCAIPMENVIVVEGVGRFSRLLGMVLSAYWACTVIVSGSMRRLRLFHYLVLLFVVWNALSLFWTIDSTRTFNRVFTYVQLIIMVVVIWDLITTHAKLHAAYQAYVLGAYVSAFSTISGYLGGDAYYQHRYAAAGFHPNGLGIILVMGMPIALYLATEVHRNDKLWRILNYAYLPIASVAIALTGTRTAVVAAVPFGLYILLTLRNYKPATQVMFGIAILGAIVFLYSVVPSSSFQRLATIGTEFTAGDLNGRMRLWEAGLEIFRHNSLVGIGSDGYRSAEGKVAHNAFISVAVELGTIGILLFCAIVAVVVYNAFTLPRQQTYFLLSLVGTWALGASALTWEHKKTTWLIMSFVILTVYAVSDDKPVGRQKYELPSKNVA